MMFSKPVYEYIDGKHELTTEAASEDMIYLNSWNFKQVIYLRGEIDIALQLSDLIDQIKACDIIPKVSLKNFKGIGNNPCQDIRVVVPKSSSLDDQDQNQILLEKYHKKLKKRNDRFNELLAQSVIPLRFSFLALLTARKVTIFSK
jgi:hypothetical protein